MRKLITESHSQFLLEKSVDMVATILDAFNGAGYPAEVDSTIKPVIDNTGMDASIDLVVQFKKGEDYISINVLSGVVYWNDFKTSTKLGEITDQKDLVKGIKKVFK